MLGTNRAPLEELLAEAESQYNASQSCRTAVHSVDQVCNEGTGMASALLGGVTLWGKGQLHPTYGDCALQLMSSSSR